MEIHLDRALTNSDWLNLFHMAKLYNIEGATSDHNPILVIPQVPPNIHSQHRFKFENAWMTDPLCEIIIKEGWMTNFVLGFMGERQQST